MFAGSAHQGLFDEYHSTALHSPSKVVHGEKSHIFGVLTGQLGSGDLYKVKYNVDFISQFSYLTTFGLMSMLTTGAAKL